MHSARDLSMDHSAALIWMFPVTVAALGIVLIPHAVLHRENALMTLLTSAGFWLIPVLLVATVAHELLHAATVIAIGRLGWKDVSYGMNWKSLMPYAHPRRPVTARVYVATAAAPGVILGILPALAGVIAGSGAWSAFGAVMLAAAGGDALIIWSLRHTPGSALVQDHPSRIGCQIVSGG